MSDTPPRALRIGTVAGPETFAGQAAAALKPEWPIIGEVTYYPTGPELFAALYSGAVDAIVGAHASIGSGYSDLNRMLADPARSLYVAAEARRPFGCVLLGARNSSLAGVRRILGGPVSIDQSLDFLGTRTPQAEFERYSDPLAAARSVADGDGSVAILGTRALAEKFGLTVLADEVDAGRDGSWWVLANKPTFEARPNVVVVVARLGDTGALGRLIIKLLAARLTLLSVAAEPTGTALLEFDYVLRLEGDVALDEVQRALSPTLGARVAGAFRRPG